MKYRCFNCENVFESKDKLEGYPNGYSKGFLCPLCKANIKPDYWSDLKAEENAKGRDLITIAICISVIGRILWGDEFLSWSGISWYTPSGILVISSIAYFHYINKNNPDIEIKHTKFVDEDKNLDKKYKSKQPWE